MLALLPTGLGAGWWVELIPTTLKGGLLIFPHLQLLYMKQGDFLDFFSCNLFNTASSADPQIPVCRRMLGLNPDCCDFWHLYSSQAL
jgi:hypothetical protein